MTSMSHAPNLALDEPVDLPFKSRTKSSVLVALVIAAFVAVFASVIVAGARTSGAASPAPGSSEPAAR